MIQDNHLLSENKHFLMYQMRLPKSELALHFLPRLFVAGMVAGNAMSLRGEDSLKPHQAVSTNTPPASPRNFNPDPNPVQLPAPAVTQPAWILRIVISSNTPPIPGFNPDPGAFCASNPAAATLVPWFHDPVAPAQFIPPAIPNDLKLPRRNLRTVELVPNTNPPPPAYGSEPLPPNLTLPRQNVRRELKIDQQFFNPDYSKTPADNPADSTPVPDRWRIGFEPWNRYTSGSIEDPFDAPEPALWQPYRQSYLKGDLPILGQDVFLDLTASAESDTEFKRIPTPSQVSGVVPGEYEFYGQGNVLSTENYLALDFNFFQGDTSFRPVDWAINVEPVFNVNYLQAQETGVVSPDPRGVLGFGNNTAPPSNGFVRNPGDVGSLLNGQVGPAGSYRNSASTERTMTYFSLQQAYLEFHLADLSDNYDFVSVRIGNQPFNADFRGFVFNDINTGIRLFGNYDNNLYQFNLAVFDLREKDTDSGLNTFNERNQRVVVANLYRQDFIWQGYTSEWSFLGNFDNGGLHYDDNGFLVRPEPLGTVVPHNLQAYYLGWGGDGHIGRFNLSDQFYQVLGRDEFNGLAGHPVYVNAQMASLEIAYDHDWARYKASFFYASGDGNASGGTASGFDSIVDNPNFIGGPFSFWSRQGFNLGGTLVNLKNENSLLPDMRSSKTEGQANFVNPGVFIYGLGAEFDLTPKLRTFLNANYIMFAQTDPLKQALFTSNIGNEVGWDLSIGFQYRPFLTDNVILSTGFGALIPGSGYRDIYRTNPNPVPGFDGNSPVGNADALPYSALIALTCTY